MDVKLVILIFAIFAIFLVNADFLYNPVPPNPNELESLGLKCVRGRTVMKIRENKQQIVEDQSEEDDYRRSHMNFGSKDDETCEICICSVEGKDEYCSKRPAMNVNECLVLARVMEEFNQNKPYDIERVLSNRIRRRDLIYHDDEIPFDVTAKCYRGRSYYTNDPNANNTDLDVGSSIESLLDYDTKDICYYCICSTSGHDASCLSRDPFYCEYLRFTRTPNYVQKRYGKLFQQDRPAYFSQLSHRIRRTMDEGMYQLVQRNRQGKNGGNQQCVPYVSKYSTCTKDNSCSGCKECSCDEEGQWNCQDVSKCLGMDSRDLDDNSIDRAWDSIEEGLKKRDREEAAKYGSALIPRPPAHDGLYDGLLDEVEKEKYAESEYEAYEVASRGDIKSFMNLHYNAINKKFNDRLKRSAATNNKTKDTHRVKFYHTVDEINEDTLKHNNDSGTIVAKKAVANFPLAMGRKSGRLDKTNSTNPLHIEYKSPLYDHHITDHHITDNKINSNHNSESKDIMHEKLHELIGNKTKEAKDKDLSKIIVNELKKGIEIVGDKTSPSISNITFTRENDTLTAMAFIAGNLLNKLWNLEKDNQGDSIETDVLKHEKIADLVDLFKEPLTLRQETFLKNALEHLASVMNKGTNDNSNIPLCEQVEKIKADLGISKNCSSQNASHDLVADKINTNDDHTPKILRTDVTNDAAIAAVEKLDNVMSLLQKYEEVQKHINNLKTPSVIQEVRTKMTTSRSSNNVANDLLSRDDNQSLNLFGNVLERITKLLVPKKKHKNIIKIIKNQNIFRKDEDLKTKLKRIYDIDLENSTFTSKDKVVLDYLVNLRNTKCHLTENTYDSSPMTDGDIIQSLSEFMKVKSFVDLLKLLEPEKTTSTTKSTPAKNFLRSNQIETTEIPVTTTTTTTTTNFHSVSTSVQPNLIKNNLAQTKDKLKGHLKAIISDLLELQKATGISPKEGNVQIAEALPCLYNILNGNRMVEDKLNYRLNKLKSVFDSIKEELKHNTATRRTDTIPEPRPKSAAIWERVIRNAEMSVKSRRFLDSKESRPKSFDEVNALMQIIDEYNNGYKNVAITRGVAPHKRLALLKTIDGDAQLYISILKKVQLFLEGNTNLTQNMIRIMNDFLNTAVLNLKLDEDVLNNLYKHREVKKEIPKNNNYQMNKKHQAPKAESMKMPIDNKSKTVKISRDEIINQLIKNRVQFYIKVKELEGYDQEDDLNIRLARKIMNYLDSKNYSLARELFKVFVAQKHQSKTENNSLPKPLNSMKTTPRSMMLAFKEPIVHFDDTKSHNMGSDMMSLTKSLMKQLTNIKNMRS